EALGVPKAIFGLDEILGNHPMGYMTVVTGGHSVMTGLLPTVVLFAHDVTIDAGARIATQVREALGVADRVSAGTESDASQNAQSQRRHTKSKVDSPPPHCLIPVTQHLRRARS